MIAELPDAVLSAIVFWTHRDARRVLRACCRRLRAATDLQLSTLHLAASDADGLGLALRSLRDVSVRFPSACQLFVGTQSAGDLGPLACALAALPPGGWPSVRIVTGVAGHCVEARLVAPLARLCPGLADVCMHCCSSGGLGGGAGAVDALADGCGGLHSLTLHLGPEEASGGLAAGAGGGGDAGAQAGVDALAAALRRLRGLRDLAVACEGGDAGCAAARSALLPAVLPALPGVTKLVAHIQGGSGPAETMVVGGGGTGLRQLGLHASGAAVAHMVATLGVLPDVTGLTLTQENG
jgi:hypothetical protein